METNITETIMPELEKKIGQSEASKVIKMVITTCKQQGLNPAKVSHKKQKNMLAKQILFN